MGGTLIKTELGHGRGWAAPAPAASIRRIDAQLGRLADINEAGRSPEQADENRQKWLAYARYLAGGPWAPKAPYALGSDESVHCWGYAADTDDAYNAHALSVWIDNGWKQTALYPGNPAKHEPWHLEYSEARDNHKNDPAYAGHEEDEMAIEDLYVEFRKTRGQAVPAAEVVNLHINDKSEISVARGAAKHIAGNLVVQISGGVPYKGAVQVTPVVRTVVAGKTDSLDSLRAREIVFTGGETFGEVAVNCALQANQRLSFRIGGSSHDFTVVSATFRGMKLT